MRRRSRTLASTTEPAHSRIGPSSFERVELCTASALLPGTEPTPPSSWAAEGTAAHRVFATCLSDGIEPFEMIGEVIEVDGMKFEVDGEMADHLSPGIDWIRQKAGRKRMLVEHRMHLEGSEMFGTADVVLPDHRPVEIIDLKYGAGVQVPAEALQLPLYGLMAVERYTTPPVEAGKVAVVTTVFQPRGTGNRYRQAQWQWGFLQDLRRRVAKLEDELVREHMRYLVGAHCRWCPNVAICPALRSTAHDAALAMAGGPGVELHLTAEELDEAMRIMPALDLWKRQVTGLAQRYLEQGGKLEHAALKPKRTVREWNDPEEAKRFMESHRIEPYKPPELKSPAMVEKQLGTVHHAALSRLWKKPPPGGYSLTTPDDSDAVDRSAERLGAAVRAQEARGILSKSKPEGHEQ